MATIYSLISISQGKWWPSRSRISLWHMRENSPLHSDRLGMVKVLHMGLCLMWPAITCVKSVLFPLNCVVHVPLKWCHLYSSKVLFRRAQFQMKRYFYFKLPQASPKYLEENYLGLFTERRIERLSHSDIIFKIVRVFTNKATLLTH